jgi:ABC-type branched-subunit amino acid transport system substrate-binding protein
MGGFDVGTFGVGESTPAATLPVTSDRTFGSGPVRVALLLPLSGEPALSEVGTSMQNGAELAMDFIAANPQMTDNITVVLKDTGSTVPGATQATNAAIQEGASLILGPLTSGQVIASGQVARTAGIPMIAFSNNPGAAAPGVYLLNVLPQAEVKRSFGYARKLGKKAFAGVFPNNDAGRLQQGAFSQVISDLGLTAKAVYNFSSESEARTIVTQLAPLLQSGQIDALFLPDRATAPSFATLLQEAGVPAGSVQIIGSADWNNDATIANTTALAGAVFPAVDEAGYKALLPQYQAKFGGTPHPFATIAYTATVLANASSLANATPRYDRAQLTMPNGFTGRDGVFRFLPDGRSEYALVIKTVSIGSTTVAEAAKL